MTWYGICDTDTGYGHKTITTITKDFKKTPGSIISVNFTKGINLFEQEGSLGFDIDNTGLVFVYPYHELDSKPNQVITFVYTGDDFRMVLPVASGSDLEGYNLFGVTSIEDTVEGASQISVPTVGAVNRALTPKFSLSKRIGEDSQLIESEILTEKGSFELTPGFYVVTATAQWANHYSGYRQLYISANEAGSPVNKSAQVISTATDKAICQQVTVYLNPKETTTYHVVVAHNVPGKSIKCTARIGFLGFNV